MNKVLLVNYEGAVVIAENNGEFPKLCAGVVRTLHSITNLLGFKFVLFSREQSITPGFLELLGSEGVGLIEHYQGESCDSSIKAYLKGLGAGQALYLVGKGDSDRQLSEDLEAKYFDLGDSATGWESIFSALKELPRLSSVSRVTKETKIDVSLNLDDAKNSSISTGIGFFDHMLEQVAKHSGISLELSVEGDLEIDEHHTIEDTALALGEAFSKALGDKRGLTRYGFVIPMDEALAQVAIDFSGRNWLVFDLQFTREKIGEMPTEMFEHFFKSFTDTAKCTLNISAKGQNEHHMIEAVFKAFGRALGMAIRKEQGNFDIPSTKGAL